MSNYLEKLKNPLWQQRRLEILSRDMCVCSDCYEVNTHNHVHHIYYETGIEPWEYPDIALVTLCELCHDREHGYVYPEKQVVKVPHFLKKEGVRPRDIYALYPCLLGGVEFDFCDETIKSVLTLRNRRNEFYLRFVESERSHNGAIGHKIDDGWV